MGIPRRAQRHGPRNPGPPAGPRRTARRHRCCRVRPRSTRTRRTPCLAADPARRDPSGQSRCAARCIKASSPASPERTSRPPRAGGSPPPSTRTASGLADHHGRGDAGVVGERDVDLAIRSAAARSATVPVTLNDGLPSPSVSTSASCQDIPLGAPSALASASLAANRAACEVTGTLRSAGGEQALHQPGTSLERLGEPGDVADVDADTDDHAPRSRALLPHRACGC